MAETRESEAMPHPSRIRRITFFCMVYICVTVMGVGYWGIKALRASNYYPNTLLPGYSTLAKISGETGWEAWPAEKGSCSFRNLAKSFRFTSFGLSFGIGLH
jgi:hypothetical protein